MPIGHRNRLARVSIDTYCSIKSGLSGCRSTPIAQWNRLTRVSIYTYCPIKYVCNCVDRYLLLNEKGLRVRVDRHTSIARLNRLVRVSIPIACNNKTSAELYIEENTYCGIRGYSIHVGLEKFSAWWKKGLSGSSPEPRGNFWWLVLMINDGKPVRYIVRGQ